MVVLLEQLQPFWPQHFVSGESFEVSVLGHLEKQIEYDLLIGLEVETKSGRINLFVHKSQMEFEEQPHLNRKQCLDVVIQQLHLEEVCPCGQ